MSWRTALIVFVFVPLIASGALCWLRSRRRNPVIMDRPQPDSRSSVYSVGRSLK